MEKAPCDFLDRFKSKARRRCRSLHGEQKCEGITDSDNRPTALIFRCDLRRAFYYGITSDYLRGKVTPSQDNKHRYCLPWRFYFIRVRFSYEHSELLRSKENDSRICKRENPISVRADFFYDCGGESARERATRLNAPSTSVAFTIPYFLGLRANARRANERRESRFSRKSDSTCFSVPNISKLITYRLEARDA